MVSEDYLPTTLIWIQYSAFIGVLFFLIWAFVWIFQKSRDRSTVISIVCTITNLSLIATLLLVPVDVASISLDYFHRVPEAQGALALKNLFMQLKLIYFCLLSFDIILCFIILPFTYFWYEECDDEAAEQQGRQSVLGRLVGTFIYTSGFIVFVVLLLLIGFFLPTPISDAPFNFFYELFSYSRIDRAFLFTLGALMMLGTLYFSIYTASGLALLPLNLIKSAPRISKSSLTADTTSQLAQNRERQRQLIARSNNPSAPLQSKDRRELQSLVRDERTLVRRERLASEQLPTNQPFFVRIWHRFHTFVYPVKLLFGILLTAIFLFIWTSILISQISHFLPFKIFQPTDSLILFSNMPTILYLLLILVFFSCTISSLSHFDIRFFWIKLYSFKTNKTSPQGLLLATGILATTLLSINYTLVSVLMPGYAAFGYQTYCIKSFTDLRLDCDFVETYPCADVDIKWFLSNSYLHPDQNSSSDDSRLWNSVLRGCTPSVSSLLVNTITWLYPTMDYILFYAQFVFLIVGLVTFVVMVFRKPTEQDGDVDEVGDEEEEQGLLSTDNGRSGADWNDITSRNTGVNRSNFQVIVNQEDHT